MKNIIILCLLGLLIWPAMTQAQFNYITKNGALTITGYTGTGSNVVIPSSVNGYPVTAIGDEAFEFNSSLTKVTIPNSVTSIGESAFDSCSGVINVTLGSGITSIGDYAFSGCSSVTNLTDQPVLNLNNLQDQVTCLRRLQAVFFGSLTNIQPSASVAFPSLPSKKT